jgi:hypothetical protein
VSSPAADDGITDSSLGLGDQWTPAGWAQQPVGGQPGTQSHSTGYVVMENEEQTVGQQRARKINFSHEWRSYSRIVKSVIMRMKFDLKLITPRQQPKKWEDFRHLGP